MIRPILRLLAATLALALALPAVAQDAGDVGRDAQGNVYTYVRDANGYGRWVAGRVGAGGRERVVLGERYTPTIWTDPDGCEHWVMDDGAEGYMTPHVTRDGRPVCNRSRACGVMASDAFFATGSSRLSAQGRAAALAFFQQATASAFGIYGHTDSRGSDAANFRLSQRRANAVAAIAQQAGKRVLEVRGRGERMPAATNATATGRAKNRRVEIACYR